MTQEHLPTEKQAEEACAFMASEIHTPAFFEKLAASGIQPKNQTEAEQLLQLGALLVSAEAEGQYKTAAETQEIGDANPFLSAAISHLAGQPSQAQVDAGIKQASDHVVSIDPMAKMAALVYDHVANGGEVATAK